MNVLRLAALTCGLLSVLAAGARAQTAATPMPSATPVVLAPAAPATTSAMTASLDKNAAAAVDNRWDASLAAFAAADKEHPPKPGGVLFVGSSSIRLWSNLESDFSSLPVVVKRGFGGSRMMDCTQHLHALVAPYKPHLVLVYAGDNDLAEGRTPQQVLQSFRKFVEGVRADLPKTRIAYISIKPSPLRASLMPQIQEANALIKAYTLTVPNADFIDVYSSMVDDKGQPRMALFREDKLHLNADGYALWKRLITAHLD
ncbi:SGNH/GDSL hydrolase family protein [Bordetella genomosp. 10]|nr:SGNH/GDSL hydrolase family protein [Bordetella genomosp. 10]